jgi:hypothetical protein
MLPGALEKTRAEDAPFANLAEMKERRRLRAY